jgi:hypothetical protein
MMTRTRFTNSAVIVRLDRTIRYAAPAVLIPGIGDYWMPAFAGHDEEDLRGRS